MMEIYVSTSYNNFIISYNDYSIMIMVVSVTNPIKLRVYMSDCMFNENFINRSPVVI